MPAEDHKNMKKVQCWIPQDTWDKIVSLGYDSPTIAVTEAFKKLLEDPREDPRINPLVSLKDPLESPEIPIYKARIEALEMVLGEKDRSIERLENDLRKADIDKEDLKATYNNYFLQVQTLINQKAIGTGPTPKEERQKESRPAPKESRYTEKEERLFDVDLEESPTIKEKPENKPVVNQEKNIKEVTCLNCGKVFTAARATRLYCSGACKQAYGRKMKKENP